jgi:hypothetical protein
MVYLNKIMLGFCGNYTWMLIASEKNVGKCVHELENMEVNSESCQ